MRMLGLISGRWMLMATLAAGGVFVACTYRDYGLTWDEPAQEAYGRLALDYFRSGFKNDAYRNYYNQRYYGPLFEMAGAAFASATGADPYEARHLLNAVVALLALPAVYRFAARVSGPRAGWLAALALLLTPRFLAFNDSKDVPFAVLVAWYMPTLAGVLSAERWSVRTLLWGGLVTGLTLAARPAGLVLLGAWAATGAAAALLRDSRWRSSATRLRTELSVVAVFAVAWAVMVIPWPFALATPLRGPIEAIRFALHFDEECPVLFAGRTLPSTALPAAYLPWYLVITTPLPLLALAATGAAACVGRTRDGRDAGLSSVLALAWVALPIGLFVVTRPNVYDGIRHFLFLLPGLAVLAGSGAEWLITRFASRRRRTLATLAIAAALLWPAREMAALHPYEFAYFNELVGGVRGADGRYDTDYWLASYKEAMVWVNAAAEQSEQKEVSVLLAANELSYDCGAHYAGPKLRLRPSFGSARRALPPDTDYYVATTRMGLDRCFPDSPIVHAVGRQGAVFTVIRARETKRVSAD
jgi:4-amino-4-deoxy-L-arabinose transferase-like glycosyltransferase